MLKSIYYLEISCKYNKKDLKLFVSAERDKDGRCIVLYRGRRYFFTYVEDEDVFRFFNSKGLIIASIVGKSFQFYVSLAPEIGLDLVWGLLAKLNIYPVKSF